MANEGAHAVTPIETPEIRLDSIWYVDEGASYDIFVPAQRTDYVMVRTLKGSGEVALKDGSTIILGANTTFIFDLRKTQRYRCNGDNWAFYWFEFRASSLSTIPLFTIMNVPVSSSERRDLEECFTLVRKSNVAALLLASAQFARLMYRNVHRWRAQVPSTNAHHGAIENVVALMHRDLTGLSVEEMAKKACLSVRRFRQVFADVTGKPPKQFYDILRLETAANLLMRGKDSLEALALRFGFSSAFHFSRAFKKHVGLSPLQYRKQSRK